MLKYYYYQAPYRRSKRIWDFSPLRFASQSICDESIRHGTRLRGQAIAFSKSLSMDGVVSSRE